MRPTKNNLKTIGCCMIVLLIIAAGITPTRANAASNTGNSQDRFVTIDFNNVDINVFIKFISELTGKNFIVDQRVRGNVTIISPTKISVAEAYKVFESVLEVNGFSTVQAGEVTKILPAPEARTSDIPTRTSTKPVKPQDQLVTQLIPLT
ncbi:MAG: type II secretion system protein GspD, partial [Desulfobacterales bacterium]